MAQSLLHKIAHLPGIDRARASLREAQQEERFLSFVQRAAARPPERPSLEQALAERRPYRRPLSQVPRVVALGHQDWEKHGLWPTFGRTARFDLFPIPAEGSRGSAGRERLGRNFL